MRTLMLVSLAILVGAGDGVWAKDDDASAPDDRYFPLSAVRPGMRGHGLTVKAGTKIERFEVEVIDVMPNNLVKQDIILVRCLGDDFADHGIAEGMSGSPIYFRDRLAGALAYTWSWSKHAIGGVTPIQAMLPEGERKLEGRPTGALPPTPLRRAKPLSSDGGRLRRIGTPIALSGFTPAARASLQEGLARDGFAVGVGAPVDGNAAGRQGNLDAPIVPGASVVVDLMRGDFSFSALGTITHVDGDVIYGFGHSFDDLGETLFPASVGYVYTVLASQNISFKMGGGIREIGALVQDRPSCIVVRKDMKAPMVPFKIRFRNAKTKREEAFAFELTPNTIYFQRLVMAAIQSAFTKAELTLGPNTKRYKMTVKLAGMEPWSYEDAVAGFDGGFRRVLMNLVDRPLIHRFQRPVFESVELDIEIERVDRRAAIRSAVASHDEVRPGQTVNLLVELEAKEGGARHFERFEVTIPSDAPTGNYAIAIVGGDFVPADAPRVDDIADLPKLYAAFHKSTELVAVLPTSRVDVDIFGKLLRRVPLSMLPRLVRSPGGDAMQLSPVTEKVVRKVPYVVDGSQEVVVRVVR